jgi:hypothetical protein
LNELSLWLIWKPRKSETCIDPTSKSPYSSTWLVLVSVRTISYWWCKVSLSRSS